MSFPINKRIADEGYHFGTLGNCHVFLKKNALFPWFILVPMVGDSVTELHHMDPQDFATTCFAIRQLSSFLEHHVHPDKINVGCIGNKVSQLHIHIVARFDSDSAWPEVVWPHADSSPYTPDQVETIQAAYDAFL